MRNTTLGRSVTGVTAALLFGSLLAACGNGGGSMVPTTQALPDAAPVSETGDALQVDASRASSVMGLVTEARAFASPVQGHSVQLLPIGGGGLQRMAYSHDLTNSGGPTVRAMKQYDILVNCASSCWGSPGTFQTNFGASAMVHILDQYTGSTANSRYTFAGYISTTYTISGTLHDQDVYNIVHAAAQKYGTGGGYGVEYHVFLARGVNECSTSAGGCYSPSNPANWNYCAYHGYTKFSDVGHVLYSVEPYQAVSGCEVTGTAPNGEVVDSTASTLSHETSETITDPDVPNTIAWYNNTYGEIGDICAPANNVSTGNVSLNGHTYNIQKEYSNYSHACKFSR